MMRFVSWANLHWIRVKTWQNELVAFWCTAWLRVRWGVAAAARIPADVMKLLTFNAGIRAVDNLAECRAFRIHVDSWQIVAAFFLQVWLNSHDVKQFLAWAVLHRPKRRRIARTWALFTWNTLEPISHSWNWSPPILPSIIAAVKWPNEIWPSLSDHWNAEFSLCVHKQKARPVVLLAYFRLCLPIRTITARNDERMRE